MIEKITNKGIAYPIKDIRLKNKFCKFNIKPDENSVKYMGTFDSVALSMIFGTKIGFIFVR
jgi:hypothetical protein